jgi:hypothetical protein
VATALEELVCDLCRGLEGPVAALGGLAELLEVVAAVVLACVTQQVMLVGGRMAEAAGTCS